jgi:hypothetical protein
VEGESLRGLFLVFVLQRDLNHLPLAVLRVGLRDLLEANSCQWSTWFRTLKCFKMFP